MENKETISLAELKALSECDVDSKFPGFLFSFLAMLFSAIGLACFYGFSLDERGFYKVESINYLICVMFVVGFSFIVFRFMKTLIDGNTKIEKLFAKHKEDDCNLLPLGYALYYEKIKLRTKLQIFQHSLFGMWLFLSLSMLGHKMMIIEVLLWSIYLFVTVIMKIYYHKEMKRVNHVINLLNTKDIIRVKFKKESK